MSAPGGQHGQATIEWVGLVGLVSLTLGAVVALVPVIDGGGRAAG